MSSTNPAGLNRGLNSSAVRIPVYWTQSTLLLHPAASVCFRLPQQSTRITQRYLQYFTVLCSVLISASLEARSTHSHISDSIISLAKCRVSSCDPYNSPVVGDYLSQSPLRLLCQDRITSSYTVQVINHQNTQPAHASRVMNFKRENWEKMKKMKHMSMDLIHILSSER